jgi:hypothetical protein
MLMRAHLVFVVVALAVTPCYAGKPVARDGSKIEKAIPLKQRGAKAVEEEMTWMMKIHGYTPLLATRDALADAVRQIKAGKKGTVTPPQPWSHGTLEHGNQWCSYWWFRTPRGRKEIYFDTGVPINTPGEVARQESVRAEYMGRMSKSLKLPGI